MTLEPCPGFYSSIGNPDFTEFSCTVDLLILCSLLPFSHSFLNYILLLMYICLGPVRDLMKFCCGYLKSTATCDLHCYFQTKTPS